MRDEGLIVMSNRSSQLIDCHSVPSGMDLQWQWSSSTTQELSI